MNSKKKNSVEEPAAVYEVTPYNEVTTEKLHPVLIQLIEKSIKQHDEGKGIPHEEVMRRFREKFYSEK
jgi:hypothetical protein